MLSMNFRVGAEGHSLKDIFHAAVVLAKDSQALGLFLPKVIPNELFYTDKDKRWLTATEDDL